MRLNVTSNASSLGPKRASPEERFWCYVTKDDECWLWDGYVFSGTGYGGLTIGSVADHTRRMVTAHRLSYEIHYGEIPDGMWVLHHCDVRLCVRPDHLFLGTARDNNLDMKLKGRAVHLVGELHPRAILTAKNVLEIRSRWAKNLGLPHGERITQAELGAAYGVGPEAISGIVNRRTWKTI